MFYAVLASLCDSETTHPSMMVDMFHSVTVVIAKWETPGHIPNPEAKPFSADGTALGRVWESRTPPDFFQDVMVLNSSPRKGLSSSRPSRISAS